MPEPLIIDECATCNWMAKAAPLENPETDVSVISTLNLGNDYNKQGTNKNYTKY